MNASRGSYPDHAREKTILEFHVDTCAYSDLLMDCITQLKELYDLTGIKKLEYVTTRQSMRELANCSTLEMMIASRIATYHLRGPKPDTKFAQFAHKNKEWVTVYETPHCRQFEQMLVQEAIPEKLIPICNAVYTLYPKVESGEIRHPLELQEWTQLLENFSFGSDLEKPASEDPHTTLAFYYNTFEQLKTYAHAIMRQSDGDPHASYEKAKDIPIVNPETGLIDNPYIIQALRVQNSLWKQIVRHDRLRDLHHDCADKALASYFTGEFSEKPDVHNRMLIAVTADVGIRREFADITTGYHLHSNGKEKTPMRPHDYEDKHYVRRAEYPAHDVFSNIKIHLFFGKRLEELKEIADPDNVEYRDRIEKLGRTVDAMKLEATYKYRDQKQERLGQSYQGMRLHREKTATRIRSSRDREDDSPPSIG